MVTTPIVIEYLIIIKEKGTFVLDKKNFITFLNMDKCLEVSDDKNEIIYTPEDANKRFTVSFSLIFGDVPSKNEKYFNIKLSSSEEGKLDEYTQLTKTLEETIRRLDNSSNINLLWNDISRKYAIEGYALINKVENLLRRLIANFMIVNVGYDWTQYHIPDEVKDRNEKVKTNEYADYLYQTYFSDIKTILFEGQRDENLKTIGKVQSFIEKRIKRNDKTIDIEELKGVIAKSLWEKFFEKDNNYKGDKLKSDLDKLNSLRNDIAHNRHIDRETLGKIRSLAKIIIETLELEIKDLPNKKLTTNEQEFQTNYETNRLLVFNGGNAYEKKVYDWLGEKYDSQKIAYGKEIDFIVETDGKTIGYEVKMGTRGIGNAFEQLKRYLQNNKLDEFYVVMPEVYHKLSVVLVPQQLIIEKEYNVKIDFIHIPID